MGNEQIWMLGDPGHSDVKWLCEKLKEAGRHVRFACPTDYFSVAVLCLTTDTPAHETWLALDANCNAKILPALFSGGKLPAIYADIKPADFSKDPDMALVGLLAAVDKFC